MQALVSELKHLGFKIVGDATENHMCLVDVKSSMGITGKVAEKVLDKVGITCNKNSIPFDTEKPFTTSGIRLGSAAMTTRGFKESEFKQVAQWIHQALSNVENDEVLESIHQEVLALTKKY